VKKKISCRGESNRSTKDSWGHEKNILAPYVPVKGRNNWQSGGRRAAEGRGGYWIKKGDGQYRREFRRKNM